MILKRSTLWKMSLIQTVYSLIIGASDMWKSSLPVLVFRPREVWEIFEGSRWKSPLSPAGKLIWIMADLQTDMDNNILFTSCVHYLFNQILSAGRQIVRLGLWARKHRTTWINMITRQSGWPVNLIFATSPYQLVQHRLVLDPSWTFRWIFLLFPKQKRSQTVKDLLWSC